MIELARDKRAAKGIISRGNSLTNRPYIRQEVSPSAALFRDCFRGLGQDLMIDPSNRRSSIDSCFRQRVIPVVWATESYRDLLSRASAVFLQGGALSELGGVVHAFSDRQLEHVSLFVHVDLVTGLENNEAGIEYLAGFERIAGVVTVHHHLTAHARRLGLLSIVRLFLSDSRAVNRGLSVAIKSHPDAIEILPAAVASKVAGDFNSCRIPRIAGGLCRTEADVCEALDSGCRAVTSTSPTLWMLNQ
jgi:glycerol uptake operon antiterminator